MGLLNDLLTAGPTHINHRILQEQSRYPYAHIGDRLPDEDFMTDYRREWDSRADQEWLRIVSAAGMSDNSSGPVECLLY